MNVEDVILRKEAEGDFYFRSQVFVNDQWGWIEGHICNLSEESIRQLIHSLQGLFTQHLKGTPDDKEVFKDFEGEKKNQTGKEVI